MNGWNYKDMEVGDKADVFLIFFDFPVQSCVILRFHVYFSGVYLSCEERPCSTRTKKHKVPLEVGKLKRLHWTRGE